MKLWIPEAKCFRKEAQNDRISIGEGWKQLQVNDRQANSRILEADWDGRDRIAVQGPRMEGGEMVIRWNSEQILRKKEMIARC